MWLFIIFGAYVCANASADVGSEKTIFRKCCPIDDGLVKFDGSEGNDKLYECLDRESAIFYNITASPLFVGENISVQYGIPENCDELKLVMLNADDLDVRFTTASDRCYDRLMLEVVNGTIEQEKPKIVTLTCIINETEHTPETKLTIDHIRKCCPRGQSYDKVYHICKKSNEGSTEESLLKRLKVSDNFIYELEEGLHCKSDQYAVELSEEFYSLEVDGSTLKVSKKDGDVNGRAVRGEWCIDEEAGRSGLVARVCTRDCAAYGAFCVRKCCPIGEHYRTRRCGSPISKCVPNDDDVPFDISKYMDPLRYYGIGDVIGIRSDLRCPKGKIMLNNSLARDHHELTKYGTLVSPFATNDDYCFEAFDSRHCPGGDVHVTAAICFVNSPLNKDFRISFWLISISSVCLALTLIVYCSLPELRNLHGRTLICHVTMMLLAFSCLARVQYDLVPNTNVCTTLGYGIYFGFIGAFAWLNVMCLDIWWTFGSMRTVQPMRKVGADRRRFLWYSLYAWSITILLTLTMFLFDKYPVADFLDADIGNGMCWFGSQQNSKTDWPHYIFFVIPMGLGTCTNFVLFMMTARHCARVKSEVHRLQAGSVGDRAKKRFRVDRAKYVLTGKLWVVMGAGWVSELVATLATQPEWLWAVVDLINELQGVFIFLILVFKPKVYYLIRKRLGLEKPDAQKQASASARTSSTFLSRTISSDERNTMRLSHGNNIKQP